MVRLLLAVEVWDSVWHCLDILLLSSSPLGGSPPCCYANAEVFFPYALVFICRKTQPVKMNRQKPSCSHFYLVTGDSG